jgi:predicted nucleotidyltransferase
MSHVLPLAGNRPTIESIARRLRPFLVEHDVIKAIVFGSYARGTDTRRSDLDLALVMETDRRFLDRYDQIQGIERLLPNVHAEILIYAPGELEAISHRPFIRSMLSEGVVVYER